MEWINLWVKNCKCIFCTHTWINNEENFSKNSVMYKFIVHRKQLLSLIPILQLKI